MNQVPDIHYIQDWDKVHKVDASQQCKMLTHARVFLMTVIVQNQTVEYIGHLGFVKADPVHSLQ